MLTDDYTVFYEGTTTASMSTYLYKWRREKSDHYFCFWNIDRRNHYEYNAYGQISTKQIFGDVRFDNDDMTETNLFSEYL